MYKFFWIHEKILTIIIFPLVYPFVLYSKYCFNKGICRKCKCGKIILKGYDSDRIYQIYACLNNSCNYKYNSVLEHNEISDSDLKIKLREFKLGKIK